MPRTRPRSCAGYTEASSAVPLPKIIAPPNPCSALSAITIQGADASAISSDVTAKIQAPSVKIRFRPYMSAMRPIGSRNMAALSMKAVTIQPSATLSEARSLPMLGRATLSEVVENGSRKALSRETTSTTRLSSASVLAGVSGVCIVAILSCRPIGGSLSGGNPGIPSPYDGAT